jgi:transcriptional antiterminator RfaH
LDIDTDRWRSVNGTRGVSKLITLDEKPVGVPSSIIERLKLREDTEGLVPLDTLGMFVAGDKIHILEGTFSGYSAIYEKMDDKKRVQLLLNFLGRETRVQLPRYAVEAL